MKREQLLKQPYSRTAGSLTRRAFLKSSAHLTASALAMPYVITSTALGSAARAPASERITIAHIGVGGMGGSHVQGFVGQDQAQSVAACDPVRERREKWASYIDKQYAQLSGTGVYKGCKTYNDFRDVLACDDIDAVVIATPCHWHVLVAVAAARAGKDVYVEKPLGLSFVQDKTLRQTALRHGTVIQYGTQQRSHLGFRFVCELVRNGRIGKLESIFVWCAPGQPGGSLKPAPVPEGFDFNLWLGPAPMAAFNEDRCFNRGKNWISDYALGFIAGWGAHPLDIAQWGNDSDHTSPVEYEGTGVFPTDGLYDTATSWDVSCRYADGVKLRFVSADVAEPIIAKHGIIKQHGTMFIGTDGWVSISRGRAYADPPSLLQTAIRPDEIRLPQSDDHRRNFLNCIRSRSQPVSPITAAVRSDTISHLSEIAIRTRRKINWDPEKETIIGDADAARMLSRSMRSPWTI